MSKRVSIGEQVSGVPFGYSHKQGRRVLGTFAGIARDRIGNRYATVVEDGKRIRCEPDTLKRPRVIRSRLYRFGKVADTHVVIVSGEGDKARCSQ